MTDISDLIIQYWPYVGVAAALLVVAILWLILGRTQRVELPPPTPGDDAPRPTLTRPGPARPPVSIAVSPAPPPEPVPVEAPAPAPPSTTTPTPAGMPLTSLKGVGPKLVTTLAGMGITSVEQLAALSGAEASSLDSQLGSFAGRLARDRVIEQARLLSAGDISAYEAQFGRLDRALDPGAPPA